MMDWNAPQWGMAAMICISVMGGYLLHGKQITVNGWPKLVDGMIVAIVLYWGGFWS